MRKSSFLTLLASVLVASPVWATPYMVSTDAPAEAPAIRRTAVSIGLLGGSSNVGDMHGSGIGAEVNAGYRWNDVTMLAQFDYLGVSESQMLDAPRRGNLMRLGMAARYLVFQVDPIPEEFGMGFWLEAGAGRQRVAWERGGTLTRNDLVFGFGMQMDITVGKKSGKPRYLGPYFAFRLNAARAPESMSDAMSGPACGGPCDTATKPSANDISAFFNLGMNWGR